jgi:3-oxoacyl-[acyl-carrier protein] reductase
MLNLDLQHKNALVCGGSKGIGKAAAIALAELGASVTVVARSAIELESSLSVLHRRNADQDHDMLVADLSDLEDLRIKMIGLASTKNYHIIINNTGGPAGGPLALASTEALSSTFSQHILASQVILSCLLDGMKKEGFGRIINVISTSVKEPIEGLGVSNTIRGAMGNWAKTLANELGTFGITVNNVLPGFTNTARLQSIIATKAIKTGSSEDEIAAEMKSTVPLGRFAEPEEIAAAIAFLASPAASYINGINIPVDGGRTRSL